MTSREDILINANELAALLDSQRALPAGAPRTRLLDVRWTLILPGADGTDGPSEPVGLADFRAGHIPDAVFVDLDGELAEHGAPEDGRHPLPSFERLQSAARRWGLNEGDDVVVYDGGGNLASARAWWLLRDAGLRVRLLDGSLPAWKRAGLQLESGEAAVDPGNVVLDSGQLPRLELADVEQFVRDGGALLDARAGERYRGEQEPIDPRAGHIPGALNTPTTDNLDAEGFFLDAAALQARFATAGVRTDAPVATYCGSGVTAAHNLVALALAGIDAALYPGSWSQWSNHELPVATGPEA
ncbi:MAG: sulfurtransferase [Ancrocorticia sp.]